MTWTKRIACLVVVNVVVTVIVVAIYAIGYEYDKAWKLYPETIRISYDASISGVFGQRWWRWFQAAIFLIGLGNVVLLTIWWLRRRSR